MLAKKETAVKATDWLDSPWGGFFEGRDPMTLTSTGCMEDVLKHVGQKVSTPPDNFVIHGGMYIKHEMGSCGAAGTVLG